MAEAHDDRLFDAERVAREIARQDQRIVERARERGVHTARDRWATTAMGGESVPVARQPDAVYALPSHARKILPAPLLAELRSILDEVRATNDEVVGLDEAVASLLLATDERVLAVRERLRRWAEDYVAARLARPVCTAARETLRWPSRSSCSWCSCSRSGWASRSRSSSPTSGSYKSTP